MAWLSGAAAALVAVSVGGLIVLSADPAHGTVHIPPGDAFTGATHNVISLAVIALAA